MTANNQVILIGRAGNDIAQDLRRLQNGGMVAELRLAVNRQSKGPDGKHITDWFTCKFWDKQAERLRERIAKGDLISVTGTLQVDTWEKDGQKRTSVYVRAYSFERLDSPRTRHEQPSGASLGASSYHPPSSYEAADTRRNRLPVAPSFTKEDYQYPGHHLRSDYQPMPVAVSENPEPTASSSLACKYCQEPILMREYGTHLTECTMGPRGR